MANEEVKIYQFENNKGNKVAPKVLRFINL